MTTFFFAAELGPLVHVAVEVVQREVGRDAHLLPFGGAVGGRGAEDRDVDLLVDDERCAQRVGDDAEIDLPVDDERVAVARGHAHVAAAQAFGLELPTDRGAQVVERDEAAASVGRVSRRRCARRRR